MVGATDEATDECCSMLRLVLQRDTVGRAVQNLWLVTAECGVVGTALGHGMLVFICVYMQRRGIGKAWHNSVLAWSSRQRMGAVGYQR